MSTTRNENEPRESVPDANSRRLTRRYIFALSTVALLTLGAQGLVQRQLHNGDSDSRVINLAGRQRMLSQRLAKAALQLRGDTVGNQSIDSRPQTHAELVETLDDWSRHHNGLQHGSRPLDLPGENSPAVTALFEELEPHFQAIVKAGEQIAKSDPAAPADTAEVATIQQHEGDFLAGMDAIVSQYVAEAEQRVERLRRLELTLLGLTLLVLLAEGLWVFRPAVRRIKHTLARLETVSDWLRKAKDEAEHGSAAKTRFLANVSHELRTPMTAVLGMTELARETDNEEERVGYLKVVEEAGESLLSLLNDLIDTARIDAGQMQLANSPFEPQEVVERVGRMMRFACSEKELELTIHKPPQRLPSVSGDARRLEQILLNLVGNAIKNTEAGSVAVGCAAVSITAERTELRFWVRDTGVGIAAADQRRIFEPFTQITNPEQPPRGGAGLGLAICRRIADAMRARLDLTSRPGDGTTVTLTGAFATADDNVPVDDDAAPTLVEAVDVLVVEDTEVNQLLIRRLLQQEGHRVDVVGSGEEAVATHRESAYDLVLVDLQLPGIDGATTAEQMSRIDAELGRPPTPMICITAHTGPAAAGVQQQFDALVTKPLQRESLMQTVAEVVRNRDHRSNDAAAERTVDNADGFDGESFDEELAAAFVEVADTQLEQLRQALDAKAFDEARVLAHRFRGQIGYFGVPAVEQRLVALESACVAGDAHATGQLGPETANQLSEVADALRDRLVEAAPKMGP